MSRNTSPQTFRDLSAAGQFAPVVSSAGSYMDKNGMLVGDDGLPESLDTPNTPFVFKGHPEATAIFAMPAADYCRTPPCPADLLTGAPVPSADADDEDSCEDGGDSHFLRAFGYALPLALLLWTGFFIAFAGVRGMVSPGAGAVVSVPASASASAQVANGGSR